MKCSMTANGCLIEVAEWTGKINGLLTETITKHETNWSKFT